MTPISDETETIYLKDDCQNANKAPLSGPRKEAFVNRMNASAPPQVLSNAFNKSNNNGVESPLSASQTSLSDSICSADDYDNQHQLTVQNSKNKKPTSTSISPSSSTSSLSNTNSRSASPNTNTSFMRRNSGNKRNNNTAQHRMSFPLGNQSKGSTRSIHSGSASPYTSSENVGKYPSYIFGNISVWQQSLVIKQSSPYFLT